MTKIGRRAWDTEFCCDSENIMSNEESETDEKPIMWDQVPNIKSCQNLLGQKTKHKKYRRCLKISLRVLIFAVLSALAVLFYVKNAGPTDFCVDHDGRYGACVNYQNCPTVLKDIRNKKRPVKCAGNGPGLSICCVKQEPNDGVTVTQYTTTKRPTDSYRMTTAEESEPCDPVSNISRIGGISYRKCLEYQELLVYPCRESFFSHEGMVREDRCNLKPESLIISGDDAEDGEFPHMVRLGYNTREEKWLCDGVLISDRFVLTAGHCTFSPKWGNVTHVRIGIQFTSEEKTTMNTYRVKNVYKHKHYKPPSKYHDIALLETYRTMRLYRYAVPACLHDGFPIDDTKVVATGWGTTKYRKDRPSDILKKVTLDKFTDEECADSCSKYGERHMDHGYDKQFQVCYGDKEGSRDTCNGDSGGPTQIRHPLIKCMYLVTSIIGSGKYCGVRNVPGVNIRIAPYLDWITGIVWPEDAAPEPDVTSPSVDTKYLLK